MERQWQIWLLASLPVWPIVSGALFECRSTLPTAKMVTHAEGEMNPSHNWVGQTGTWVKVNIVVLFAVIYAVKFLLTRLSMVLLRLYYFVMLLLVSLPYIWLLVVTDWNNLFIYRESCWVYYPIGIWFIPTISFLADLKGMRKPEGWWYIVRSIIEIALFFPWAYVWVLFAFWVLEGGWI